jgi:hypothetical protein
MTRLEEQIAELRAVIAKLESEHSAQAESGTDPSLMLLRSQLAQLQESAAHLPAANRESERKLLTIVFADISGFTALADTMDPEGARELVDAYGLQGWGAGGSLLPYSIEFENSTNATAPAQQVNVSDFLSSNLDWGTF